MVSSSTRQVLLVSLFVVSSFILTYSSISLICTIAVLLTLMCLMPALSLKKLPPGKKFPTKKILKITIFNFRENFF